MLKKLKLILLGLISLLVLASCSEEKGADIITTNYVGYDFVREVTKDVENISYSMLLKPGSKVHGYDPSSKDIRDILSCKLFIYVGGESDSEWVEKSILPKIDYSKTKVINMFTVLENNNGLLVNEEDPASADEEEEGAEEEYDEHVWNDIDNALIILNAITTELKVIYPDYQSAFENNSASYQVGLREVDQQIIGLCNSKPKKTMIFADRFPLLYFVNRYGLSYDACFKGCSTQIEASRNSIMSLASKVEENNSKYIFVIELSDKRNANTILSVIRDDINAGRYNGEEPQVLTFYSMHNVSVEDFNSKKSYLDYMRENLASLRLLLE